MKKIIFCLITVAAITMLLIPSGKAYAFGCINFDKFDDFVLDLNRWTVENDGGCYDYEIENGKLKVTKTAVPCANRIFFIPKTSKQVKSISAEVTVLGATELHRARLLADPIMMRHGESGFHQLALMEPIWDPCNYQRHFPNPGLVRFIMNPYPGGPSLFDGIFRRDAFFGPQSGPWPPEQIIGETYKLYLRVRGNEITSRIIDESGESLGTIRYTPPGGLKLRGHHVLGLSCYGPDGTGTVLYDNVRLCFW